MSFAYEGGPILQDGEGAMSYTGIDAQDPHYFRVKTARAENVPEPDGGNGVDFLFVPYEVDAKGTLLQTGLGCPLKITASDVRAGVDVPTEILKAARQAIQNMANGMQTVAALLSSVGRPSSIN